MVRSYSYQKPGLHLYSKYTRGYYRLATVIIPNNKSFTRRILKSVLYYVLFYAAITGFTAGLLGLYMNRLIDKNRPLLTGLQSALRGEPGLSVVPITDTGHTLIAFKNFRDDTFLIYNDALYAFMYAYEDSSQMQDSLRQCDFINNTHQSLDVDLDRSSCVFNANWAYRCNINRMFGYDDSSPCFILTLNSIYGWLPSTQNGVTVCCHGATPNDDDLIGTLCIYDALVHDEEGCDRSCGLFPQQYFPYLNQESYMAPLVFLEVRDPRKNVLISIQCELENTTNPSRIEFELLVD
ncbi:hypothetical protein EG68_00645 [Paragonimus skrjabini miyazakii]|uniref:Uncharacterized protein n=1 Tax=Paragonimus skrjabini miyazakii TaxID=59628 RepID=A0A8S9ZCK7_9TREM|nr:hypothetical protein EG68_00645 [Paragonimus skrjabini miyazakii]